MKTKFPSDAGKKRGPLEIGEGKGISIPICDAGGGKVLLTYYADGERKS